MSKTRELEALIDSYTGTSMADALIRERTEGIQASYHDVTGYLFDLLGAPVAKAVDVVEAVRFHRASPQEGTCSVTLTLCYRGASKITLQEGTTYEWDPAASSTFHVVRYSLNFECGSLKWDLTKMKIRTWEDIHKAFLAFLNEVRREIAAPEDRKAEYLDTFDAPTLKRMGAGNDPD